MKDYYHKKNSFGTWFFFNIVLPLAPVFIKLVIEIFGDAERIVIHVLESSELLYFNFVICVLFLYHLLKKRQKNRIEYWMEIGAFLIIILDIILLVLIYVGQQASKRIMIAAIIISVLVPVIVSTHRYREEVRHESV